MAKKTTLNAKNLEALGAKRPSERLIEVSTGSAAQGERTCLVCGPPRDAADLNDCRDKPTQIADLYNFLISQRKTGGEGGIRTPDTVARMPHFECGAFDHSATSPGTMWSALLARGVS